MDITWDSRKADVNLAKHGVTFADVEVVLNDPLALTAEDPDAEDERRFLTIGADSFGRIVAVVYTYRDEAQIRLISARRATRNERSNYARGI
ncbi:MAG: BrnT family toxin [Gammaproteobacteria bacterium]|nr:BrnT family toxin [Gammaproteobacteria bacterium]